LARQEKPQLSGFQMLKKIKKGEFTESQKIYDMYVPSKLGEGYCRRKGNFLLFILIQNFITLFFCFGGGGMTFLFVGWGMGNHAHTSSNIREGIQF
jgi:hypothetical protein